MLEAVYLDLVATRSVVGIVPRPPFYTLFESLLGGSSAEVKIFKPQTNDGLESPFQGEPVGEEEGGDDILSWWRRGRVELALKHELAVLVAINWTGVGNSAPARSPHIGVVITLDTSIPVLPNLQEEADSSGTVLAHV